MKKRKSRRYKPPKEVIVVNVTPKKRNIRILDLEDTDKHVNESDKEKCDDNSVDKPAN
tara:strand:- start:851 stop:1024 length:174 start_codon:yes stop_codon:yes gene_type:complete